MLIQRWFSDKLRPLWRIENLDSGASNYDIPPYASPSVLVRIVRTRRPIAKCGTKLDDQLPCIQISEAECCVYLNDRTVLYAHNLKFFELLESYINEIEERDSLGIWKQMFDKKLC